jgi:hypothetical protein
MRGAVGEDGRVVFLVSLMLEWREDVRLRLLCNDIKIRTLSPL